MCVESSAGGRNWGSGTGTTMPETGEEATVAAAEDVLSRRFGSTVGLAEPEDLGGSGSASVVRVRVASSPFTLPRTLVLKHYPPQRPGDTDDGFAREAVSYQLFTALAEDDRMCPELFAHGGGERVLVLEDLGKAPTLADKLLGSDPRAAEHALLSWSRSLGRLHATTAGREADFDALMRRQETACDERPLVADVERAQHELPGLLAAVLGRDIPGAAEIVAERTRWLLEGSRHRAFSPSDVCPDNNLITGKGVRFLDFEGGGMRDALLDAGHLVVPFPLCRSAFALPRATTDAMLGAWRSEVTGMWPELAQDDVLESHLLDARLFWAWISTWRLLPGPGEPDGPVDPTTRSPRRGALLSSQWHAVAAEAERLAVASVAEPAGTIAAALTARFGSHLDFYPAFR